MRTGHNFNMEMESHILGNHYIYNLNLFFVNVNVYGPR